MDRFNISRIKLESLRLVGQGSEAKVYELNRKFLLKIYHYIFSRENFDLPDKVANDIKEVVKNNYYNSVFAFYDKDGVKLNRIEAMKMASARQEKIKLSTLPITPIYVDGKFGGYVLQNHRFCVPIHSFRGLPKSIRLRMMRNVYNSVLELLKENIYPIDLNNKKNAYDYINPFGKEENDLSHSNVLVSLLNLKPEIIDLDGISTIYLTDYDCETEMNTLRSLMLLIMDILHPDIEMNCNMQEADYDFILNSLIAKGYDSDFIDVYFDNKSIDHDVIKKLLN